MSELTKCNDCKETDIEHYYLCYKHDELICEVCFFENHDNCKLIG